MKTINLTITLLLLLVISCTSKTQKNEHSTDSLKNTSAIDSAETNTPKKSILNSENLAIQTFKVDASKRKTFTSKGGVKFTIPKSCFVDSEGNTIKGEVEIEYKEALDPTAIVLGNMTTTYDGKFLESGGMIYINASANGEQLSLANNKAIDFEVPAANRKDGMMLFEGKEENGKINWVEPKEIDEPKKEKDLQKLELKKVESAESFWDYYSYSSVPSTGAYIAFKLNDSLWLNNGIINSKWNKINSSMREIAVKNNNIPDTTYEIEGIKVQLKVFPSEEEFEKFSRFRPLENRNLSSNLIGATNTFAEDKRAAYIFKVKKLGWANIDRLFSDPRTKDVNFITKIDEPDAFDKLYISILFPKQNMYIPGYQKKDGTFSFTHGDYEEPKLPIGETAIIIATGYKKNIPYLATKKLIIAKEQTVSLQLKETTEEQLKADLKARI